MIYCKGYKHTPAHDGDTIHSRGIRFGIICSEDEINATGFPVTRFRANRPTGFHIARYNGRGPDRDSLPTVLLQAHVQALPEKKVHSMLSPLRPRPRTSIGKYTYSPIYSYNRQQRQPKIPTNAEQGALHAPGGPGQRASQARADRYICFPHALCPHCCRMQVTVL